MARPTRRSSPERFTRRRSLGGRLAGPSCGSSLVANSRWCALPHGFPVTKIESVHHRHQRASGKGTKRGETKPSSGDIEDTLAVFETPHGTDYFDFASPEEMEIPGGPDTTGCQFYFGGHVVHWLPFKHSLDEPHQMGRLVAAADNLITVDFLPGRKRYRNHDVQRLVDTIGLGATVAVCEKFAVLRSGGAAFSIGRADAPWIECDYTPLTAITLDALAERMLSHGGYSVPNEVIADLLDQEDGDEVQSMGQ